MRDAIGILGLGILLGTLALGPLFVGIHREIENENKLKKIAINLKSERRPITTTTNSAHSGDRIYVRMRSKDYWEGYLVKSDENTITICFAFHNECVNMDILKREIEAEVLYKEPENQNERK